MTLKFQSLHITKLQVLFDKYEILEKLREAPHRSPKNKSSLLDVTVFLSIVLKVEGRAPLSLHPT